MKRVALLIETSRTYGRDLLRGVQRYNEIHDRWSVFVEVRDLESRVPPWLSRWDGDGILVRSGSRAIAEAVRKTGVPAVELRSASRQKNCPFVGVDNQVAGQLVARHFLERGFRHFGVYELDTETFFIERRNSFVETIRQAGYTCSAFSQSGHSEKPSQWERQQQRLMNWLQTLPQPTAVMACTDQLGCWLLDACRRAKLHVPEQIAVVGVEDDETLATLSTPPLSSLRLPGRAAGYAAAELLDRMMHGQTAEPASLLIPPTGISTRLSSDIFAVEDPQLAAALRLIREQACSGLRVKDLLEQLPVSRSHLEREMRQLLGRSPNEQINHIRLERVKDLLRETDFTLEEIARQTAFTTAQYLAESFRRKYDQSAGQYRKTSRTGVRD
ncbi:MAG: XylR family transcriptional regulator [Planctomycetaceae bacterium]|nr:XylR family transcriptional regulator [Planctomycetaceae bacterium]